MSTSGPRRERSNENKRRSSDLLTIDELINRIGMKARSRGGRLFLSILGLAVAAIIVVIPLTRSAKAYSPAAKPQESTDPVTIGSTAPSRTTLPTLPLDLFAPHSTTPSSLSTTTTTPVSSSTTTSSSTTSVPSTTVAPATVPPRTTPQTAPPPGPPDTGVGVPVG